MRTGGARSWGIAGLAALAISAVIAWPLFAADAMSSANAAERRVASADRDWVAFTPETVSALNASGRPVFVDFTAAWCVTCQVNKRLVLNADDVRARFAAKRVALVRADWTRRDPAITQALAALGRNGVPVYVLYRPGKEPLLAARSPAAEHDARGARDALGPLTCAERGLPTAPPAVFLATPKEKTMRYDSLSPWLALTMLFAAGAAVAVVSGAAAPGFTITDTSGKAVQLADYKGKYVVLEWTNPECPFVRKHYGSGNMQALQKEWGARDVVWLTINSTNASHSEFKTPRQMGDWMKAQGAAPLATLLDSTSDTGRAYGAKTTPHMFVIDPAGKVIYAGAIDDKRSTNPADAKTANNYVRAALTEAMSGKPVTVGSTTPYGCSVKY